MNCYLFRRTSSALQLLQQRLSGGGKYNYCTCILSKNQMSLFVQRCYLGTYKKTTGLIGLSVDPDGKKTMQRICDDVLAGVQKLPSNSEYRVNTEEWFHHISEVLRSTDDVCFSVRLCLKTHAA